MIAKMIVNRTVDWFQIKDLELDSCVLAMELLKRLSTRKLVGFKYDRIKLADTLLHRKSSETIEAVDEAIIILVSRGLIDIEEIKYGERKITISEAGLSVVEQFKELMENED